MWVVLMGMSRVVFAQQGTSPGSGPAAPTGAPGAGGTTPGGAAGAAGAAGTGANTIVALPNPLSANNLQDVVASISKFLLIIAVPLVAVMALVGGFQMITATGNPEKFATGRKTLLYAVIGFAVVLLSSGVAQIIQGFLNGK
jgi:magnesium-transporting ATPase (P-type)